MANTKRIVPIPVLLCGILMTLLYYFMAIKNGYVDWVVQQAVLFACAMGWIPGAHRIPFLGHLLHDIDRLRIFYRDHPEYLSIPRLLLRFVPFLNIILMLPEIGVLIMIIVMGMPLDIGLEILTTYVLKLPTWGAAAQTDIFGRIGYEMLLTFTVTPYLVWIVIGLRGVDRSLSKRES
jgi:hypothetical protein